MDSQLRANNKAFVRVHVCAGVMMMVGNYSGGAKDGGGFRFWEDDLGSCGF